MATAIQRFFGKKTPDELVSRYKINYHSCHNLVSLHFFRLKNGDKKFVRNKEVFKSRYQLSTMRKLKSNDP